MSPGSAPRRVLPWHFPASKVRYRALRTRSAVRVAPVGLRAQRDELLLGVEGGRARDRDEVDEVFVAGGRSLRGSVPLEGGDSLVGNMASCSLSSRSTSCRSSRSADRSVSPGRSKTAQSGWPSPCLESNLTPATGRPPSYCPCNQPAIACVSARKTPSFSAPTSS